MEIFLQCHLIASALQTNDLDLRGTHKHLLNKNIQKCFFLTKNRNECEDNKKCMLYK